MKVSLIGLFSELDCQPDLGVTNYGVSMTTLEDVFLRLEAETEVDQAGECVTSAQQEYERMKKPKLKLPRQRWRVFRLQRVQSGANRRGMRAYQRL